MKLFAATPPRLNTVALTPIESFSFGFVMLNVILPEFMIRSGEFTMNDTVVLELVLLKSSLQVTFHLWVPWLKLNIVVALSEPDAVIILLTLTEPSRLRLHVRFVVNPNWSSGVKLKDISFVLKDCPSVGWFNVIAGPCWSTILFFFDGKRHRLHLFQN